MNAVAKRTLTALTTAALVAVAILTVPPAVFPSAFGLLFLLAAFECFQLVARRCAPFSLRGLAVLLPALALLALAFAVLAAIVVYFGPKMLLYVIALVKVSDMGGFALGKACGRHLLCPTVSPKKTWEGLLGSVLASCIMACLFLPLTHAPLPKALACGVVAALVGTAGDLLESRFKRWAGVKDSATFMPAGLGGFLDMFDSLLLAPAVLMLLMVLFQ